MAEDLAEPETRPAAPERNKKPDLARSMATVPDLLAAGATDVHVTLRAFNRDPADAPAVLEEIVRRFAEVV